jgi:hypothetical protein
MISSNDLASEEKLVQDNKIESLEKNYTKEKKERAKVVNKEIAFKVKDEQQYHLSTCVPESAAGGAFARYDAKHANCIRISKEKKDLIAKRDLAEKQFFKKHSKSIEDTKLKAPFGLFTKVTKSIELLNNDKKTKIPVVIIFAIFLFSLESVGFQAAGIALKEITLSRSLEEEKVSKKLKEEHNMAILQIQSSVENTAKIIQSSNKFKHFFHMSALREALLRSLSHIEDQGKVLNIANTESGISYDNSSIHEDASSTEPPAPEPELEKEEEINYPNPSVEESSEGSPLYNIHSVYYASKPMKDLADDLFRLSQGEIFKFSQLIFEYAVNNILYQENHDLLHYKVARSVFNSKSAICGEMAIFVNSLLRYKGFPCDFIQVNKDNNSDIVAHACSGLRINDSKYVLIDVAYKTFDIAHQDWTIISDEGLIERMKSWNQ